MSLRGSDSRRNSRDAAAGRRDAQRVGISPLCDTGEQAGNDRERKTEWLSERPSERVCAREGGRSVEIEKVRGRIDRRGMKRRTRDGTESDNKVGFSASRARELVAQKIQDFIFSI